MAKPHLQLTVVDVIGLFVAAARVCVQGKAVAIPCESLTLHGLQYIGARQSFHRPGSCSQSFLQVSILIITISCLIAHYNVEDLQSACADGNLPVCCVKAVLCVMQLSGKVLESVSKAKYGRIPVYQDHLKNFCQEAPYEHVRFHQVAYRYPPWYFCC
jgi:hypothetical protein